MNGTGTVAAGGWVTFGPAHHFTAADGAGAAIDAGRAEGPLSVIVQVTRRCNFACSFCSETAPTRDPSLSDLEAIAANLRGVPRVFLSGGEPLLRRDIVDVAALFSEFVVGLPTNATRSLDRLRQLAPLVAFANVGLDGPRSATSRVRGDYDAIMRGISALADAGISVSLSAVVLRSTLGGLPFTYQIADVVGAGKLKLILPLRKGNAVALPEREFISRREADSAFRKLAALREEHGWAPALRMTTWSRETEGHMIVVEPDGTANAWPVLDAPGLVETLGNAIHEPVGVLWGRYRFKRNHYAKYLGQSIRTLERATGAVVRAT